MRWVPDLKLDTGLFFLFQAEDVIRDLVRSRGLGDVYKRQYVGKAEVGQNMRASVAQLVAETLHMAPEQITVILSLIHI